jgi:hypothetical protein
MNQRQRRQYWIRQRNQTVRLINKWKAKFERALQIELRLLADAVERGEGRNFANTRIFSDAIFSVLQALYKEIAVSYAKTNYDTLRREKLLMGSNEEWFRVILEYLGQNFYNNGTFAIVKTNQKLFNSILDKSINEGWGVDETVRYILNDQRLGVITANRAEMIARTETGKAIHAGTYVGADRSPFLKEKMWISARDNRTRGNPMNDRTPQDFAKKNPDHYYMDGQTVDFNAKFVDPRSGAELEHPHDPQAQAKDVIQCRCTYAVTNKRDKNGRLIRKPDFLLSS